MNATYVTLGTLFWTLFPIIGTGWNEKGIVIGLVSGAIALALCSFCWLTDEHDAADAPRPVSDRVRAMCDELNESMAEEPAWDEDDALETLHESDWNENSTRSEARTL